MSTRKLTHKQRLFVNFYCQHWNGAKAARQAGYSGNDNTLTVVASQNLMKHNVIKAIDRHFTSRTMDSDEVLFRLGDIARGNLLEFVKQNGNKIIVKDLDEIKDIGHLIKKLKQTKDGIEIELYSSLTALNLLAKYHNLIDNFTTNLNIDITQLTDYQLDQLEAGHSIFEVLASENKIIEIGDGK